MTNITYTLFLLFTYLFACLRSFGSPEQDFVIYAVDNTFIVKTDLTGEIVYSSQDAAMAIQWAIDQIDVNGINAGEIFLKKGSYLLKRSIVVPSNIWLHGEGPDTKLFADGQIMEAIVIQDATMSMISDFSLSCKNNELNADGIVIDRSVNCQVLDLHVSDFNRGIRNRGESSLVLIRGNTMINNSTAIYIQDGGGVVARWLPLFISGNTIEGGNKGISCRALVTHILDNTISNTSGRAIEAMQNSILVNGNRIENAGGDFAIFGDGAEFNCTENIISNAKGGGIRTRKRWGTISGNEIINCGTKDDPAVGILVVSDDSSEGPAESKVIFRNTIYNEDDYPPLEYGIKEMGWTSVISENKIGRFSNQAILSEGEGTIVVNNTEMK